MSGKGHGLASNQGGTSPASASDDRALVVRIAAREEAALRAAIDGHATILHRIAYRMMGEAHEAEDIVQEAMLRLWDHAKRLEAQPGAIHIAPWLKRVTINLAIDRLRVTRRVSGEEVPEVTDCAPLADEAIAQSQEFLLARQLVGQLPENQRAAIVLTYFEEQSNAQAATILDMKLKAFESLLHRARSALRQAFEQHETREGLA